MDKLTERVEIAIDRAKSMLRAYPTEMFPSPTKQEIADNPKLISKASAAMGRHAGKVWVEPMMLVINDLEADRQRLMEQVAIAHEGLDAADNTINALYESGCLDLEREIVVRKYLKLEAHDE